MAGQLQCVALFLAVTTLGVCTALVIDTKRSSPLKDYAPIQPFVPLKAMNPIDACLFACNMCYRQVSLLH